MATLSEIARKRKNDLKAMLKWSRNLDAEQEKLEREVKRLHNRKRAVPEAKDAQRVIEMLSNVQAALNTMEDLMLNISEEWT